MRKLSYLLAFVALCASILWVLAVPAAAQNIEGQPIAAQYGAWKVPSTAPDTYSFVISACTQQAGTQTFHIFQTNAPLRIVDSNPALSETVTPSNYYASGQQCSIVIAPVNEHQSFYITSGTGGLQEALNANAGNPAANTIIISNQWYVQGGTTAIIGHVKGSTSIGLVDVTTTPYTSYVWNGAQYVVVSSGGGSSFVPNTDLGGTALQTNVVGINGQNLAALGAGIYKFSAAGVPSKAVAGTDYVIPSGNVASATTAGTVSGIVPVANGGTGTTAPGLVGGSNVTITGAWPNQTISSVAGFTPNTDLSGTATATRVVGINGQNLAALGAGPLQQNASGVPSISPTLSLPTCSGTTPALTFNGTSFGCATTFTGAGDITGSSTSQTVVGINNTNIAGLGAGVLQVNASGIPSIAPTLLLPDCSSGQVLTYISSAFSCVTAGAGTITGVTAGTGLTGGGTSGTVTVKLATPVSVANGGTGTASPSLVGGTNITISGTWPNQTVDATATGGMTALTGDVTASGTGSVVATVTATNGRAIPANTKVVGTNGSSQIVGTSVTANSLLGSVAAGAPGSIVVPGCAVALIWTTGTGFGCTAAITASGTGGLSFESGLSTVNTNGTFTSSGNSVEITGAQTITSTSFYPVNLILPEVGDTAGQISSNSQVHGHCSIYWQQQTAVSTVQFALYDSATPNSLYTMNTLHSGTGGGTVTDTYIAHAASASTTALGPYAISASGAPGAVSTAYRDDFDFSLVPGPNANQLQVYALTGNASDALMILAGSYCQIYP